MLKPPLDLLEWYEIDKKYATHFVKYYASKRMFYIYEHSYGEKIYLLTITMKLKIAASTNVSTYTFTLTIGDVYNSCLIKVASVVKTDIGERI